MSDSQKTCIEDCCNQQAIKGDLFCPKHVREQIPTRLEAAQRNARKNGFELVVILAPDNSRSYPAFVPLREG